MADIDPMLAAAISQMRSLAYSLEAVAVDLENAGITAEATRRQIAIIREHADQAEATELAVANGAASGRVEKLGRDDVKVVEKPDLVRDTGLTLQGLIVWEYPPTGERWTTPDARRSDVWDGSGGKRG